MSRIAITVKLKMCWFPDEASCRAEKVYTDIDLTTLMPGKDKTLVSLYFWILEHDDVTCRPRIVRQIFRERYSKQSFLFCQSQHKRKIRNKLQPR